MDMNRSNEEVLGRYGVKETKKKYNRKIVIDFVKRIKQE